MFLAAVVAVE